MYKGKRARVKKFRKAPVLLVSLALLLSVATATTLAFLTTDTTPIVNTFVPAQVPNSVQEDFDRETKTNVRIRNDGNVKAYIRAAVVVNWVDQEGNICPEAPKATDYQITWWDEGWFEAGGYYYHKSAVGFEENENQTSVLISKCKPLVEKEGYHLSVEIMGQSIQAEPETAVKEAWKNVSVSSDKTLTVN